MPQPFTYQHFIQAVQSFKDDMLMCYFDEAVGIYCNLRHISVGPRPASVKDFSTQYADAYEAANNAILIVAKKIGSYNPAIGEFRSYLHTSLENALKDILKVDGYLPSFSNDIENEPDTTESDTDERVRRHKDDAFETMIRFIDTLPEIKRAAVYASAFGQVLRPDLKGYGRNYADILAQMYNTTALYIRQLATEGKQAAIDEVHRQGFNERSMSEVYMGALQVKTPARDINDEVLQAVGQLDEFQRFMLLRHLAGTIDENETNNKTVKTMSVWGGMLDRGAGESIRKEDVNLPFLHDGTNKVEDLPAETKDILSLIYEFNGFSSFLPADILEDAGKVKVFLDEKEDRTVLVPLKKLEEELESLKQEVADVSEQIEDLKKAKRPDQARIGKLEEKKRQLEKKIKRIKDIIAKAKSAGIDSWSFPVTVLGYYWRDPGTDKHGVYSKSTKSPEIHLMVGTIKNLYGPVAKHIAMMTGIVFVHELMHAFFDNHDPYIHHDDYRIIEEPIAEYGMLRFMEMFERCHPKYEGILEMAMKHVESKQDIDGVCHYGFGRYLFDERADFCVDWVTLFHLSWPSLVARPAERQEYESLISPIKYPRNECFCESKLFDVLKAKRFFCSGYEPGWRDDGSEFYLTVNSIVAKNPQFLSDYPAKRTVRMTFVSKTGTILFGGEATVVSKGRFLVGASPLLDEFVCYYGALSKPSFAFYEEKPSDGIHTAEWVAIEL